MKKICSAADEGAIIQISPEWTNFVQNQIVSSKTPKPRRTRGLDGIEDGSVTGERRRKKPAAVPPDSVAIS